MLLDVIRFLIIIETASLSERVAQNPLKRETGMKLCDKIRNETSQPEVLPDKLNDYGKLCRLFFTRYVFLAAVRGHNPGLSGMRYGYSY